MRAHDEPGGIDAEIQKLKKLVKKGAYKEARALGDTLGSLTVDRAHATTIATLRARARYKDPELTPRVALEAARKLLADFLPECESPETLGVAGAIERRFYELDLQVDHLERAFDLYRRGQEFDQKTGYPSQGYPGINAAYLLDMLASLGKPEERSAAEASRRREEAKVLRTELVKGLRPLAEDPAKEDYFLLVTLAEAHLGLDSFPEAQAQLARAAGVARATKVEPWELETTGRQLAALLCLRAGGVVPPEGRRALAALFEDRTDALFPVIAGKLGLALSGGGFRASFFHIGVLAHLANLDLLRYVEVLSCVSGGSLLGALYYLELKHLYENAADGEIKRSDYVALVSRVEDRFRRAVQHNIRMRVLFDPIDNWLMLRGKRSRTVRAGELYEQYLYAKIAENAPRKKRRPMCGLMIRPEGRPFSPWQENWGRRAKVPAVIFNATTLNTGHNWQFTAKGMGEPPLRQGEDIDTNPRFERASYCSFKKPAGKVYLGSAVAASACVPIIFDPLEIRGAYGDHVVGLVDGGVHDNQGTSALLDQGCTAILVSDASGQMDPENDPIGNALRVGLRSDAIFQARIREAQYMDLRSRERGKLLRSVTFLHLRQGLEVEMVRAGPAHSVVAPGDGKTPYGVSRAVQARLAALRTDLDTFSDLEADMLMMSGWMMANEYVGRETFSAGEVKRSPSEDSLQEQFRFLRARPLMKASPAGGPADRRVLELLRIGRLTVGKAWLVNRAITYLGCALVAGLVVLGAVLAWHFRHLDVVRFTLGGLVAALALMGLERILPPVVVPWWELLTGVWLVRRAREVGLALTMALGARLSVYLGDWLYLRAGKTDAFLEPKPKEAGGAGPRPPAALTEGGGVGA